MSCSKTEVRTCDCSCPPRRANQAFTLIELLVVVAIIAMLIGILIPSLSAARDSAKRVKTRSTMKVVGDDALELFRSENESDTKPYNYPPSAAGDDPTEDEGGLEMFGAQWLVRYLTGKDQNGWISPRVVPRQYWNFSGGQDMGYLQKGWYDPPGEGQSPLPNTTDTPFTRGGPYVNTEGVSVKAPRTMHAFVNQNDVKSKNPVFVDPYEMPILYYAANSGYAANSKANITTTLVKKTGVSETGYPGIYNWGDNVYFTGGCTCGGNPGVCTCLDVPDYGNGAGPLTYDGSADHASSAWKDNPPSNWKAEVMQRTHSFAYYILNKEAYQNTCGDDPANPAASTAVIPMRKDSFILISPGKDGQFGTRDDVTNFD